MCKRGRFSNCKLQTYMYMYFQTSQRMSVRTYLKIISNLKILKKQPSAFDFFHFHRLFENWDGNSRQWQSFHDSLWTEERDWLQTKTASWNFLKLLLIFFRHTRLSTWSYNSVWFILTWPLMSWLLSNIKTPGVSKRTLIIVLHMYLSLHPINELLTSMLLLWRL